MTTYLKTGTVYHIVCSTSEGVHVTLCGDQTGCGELVDVEGKPQRLCSYCRRRRGTRATLNPGDSATLVIDQQDDKRRVSVHVQAISPAIIYAAGMAFQVSNGLCVDEYGVRLECRPETEE
jgi:hypothetical protein